MDVEFVDKPTDWFDELDAVFRKRVTKIVDQLAMSGRGLLGTKYAKKLIDTDDLYELVIDCKGHPLRLIFSFESNGSERAVVLAAGDKKGDDRFYDKKIGEAERAREAYRQDKSAR